MQIGPKVSKDGPPPNLTIDYSGSKLKHLELPPDPDGHGPGGQSYIGGGGEIIRSSSHSTSGTKSGVELKTGEEIGANFQINLTELVNSGNSKDLVDMAAFFEGLDPNTPQGHAPNHGIDFKS